MHTESLAAHKGPMCWSPIITAETVHGSECERFSSEEPGSGAELAGMVSLCASAEVDAIDERKVKIHSRVEVLVREYSMLLGMNTYVMSNKYYNFNIITFT